MFEYHEIITNRNALYRDIKYWQKLGWEVVSHAIYPNNNISLLFRRDKEHAVEQ